MTDPLEHMKQRAIEIHKANNGPDSYYHVAGDEPVDFALDDEINIWASAWTEERIHFKTRIQALEATLYLLEPKSTGKQHLNGLGS